jgi:hypothetical protein
MIAPRCTALIVEPLLHYRPFTIARDYEAVQINLESVRDGVVVDAGRQPAGTHERVAIKTVAIRKRAQFVWGIARVAAAAPTDIQPEFVGS